MVLLIPIQLSGVVLGLLLPVIVVLIIFRFLWDISGYAAAIADDIKEMKIHTERIADELENRDMTDDK
jgi:hypothetical protein